MFLCMARKLLEGPGEDTHLVILIVVQFKFIIPVIDLLGGLGEVAEGLC